MNKSRFTLHYVFLFCALFLSEALLAQLGFCNGNSGDPIFTENFGTGTSYGPPLPTGTTNYDFVGFNGPQDGEYTVGPNTFGNGWNLPSDHTPNDINGKALIVNASFTAGEFYNRTINGLCGSTTYEFSSWLINILPSSGCGGSGIPINVSFEIWDSTNSSKLAIGTTGNIFGSNSPTWQKFGLVFQTLVGQNTIILKMINNGQGGCGNDLAIDDIEFKSCGDIVTMSDSTNNTSVNICSSQLPYETILTATPDFSVFTSHFYQWQESTDGINWVDIPGETNQTISISTNASRSYRSKIAEFAINLDNPQCVIYSNVYIAVINQLPITPTTECWEVATINGTTCSWEITGTQPTEPSGLNCWETATFNNTNCSWQISGTQPVQPTIECWESITFDTTTCSWEITGTQPTEPTLECWETATFNTTTCLWEVIGTKPTQPTTALECWETQIFNNTTCTWEVTGTQPVQPTIDCWETTTFNNTTCIWEITGTQPTQPTVECWENTSFNNATCAWEVTGAQPIQPTIECWETISFNNTTCIWEKTGIPPTEPIELECWEITIYNDSICVWEITGAQEPIPTDIECWEIATFNGINCTWEVTGELPIVEIISSEENSIVVTTSTIGDYLYSLDGITFQSDPVFYNIDGGLYTIYVKARNCIEVVSIEYLHFYIPQFFTPNNDGFNDTFELKGIENYGTYEVYIYNRFGKILKSAINTPFSWDGMYNGIALPSSDYWYIIIIEDQRLQGHFTLKR